MARRTFSLCILIAPLLLASIASATTLSDSLVKRFKTIDLPHQEVTARIVLTTDVPRLDGERNEDTVLLAYRTHAKLVSVFRNNGWQADDPLLIEVIDAGSISLLLDLGMNLKLKETLRLQAYVYPCDPPLFNYRGGSLEQFFQKQVLEKAEQCFTYDEKLQGKNYPY